MHDPRRILLYGDVDLRYTDGSAVWLISMARAMTSTGSLVSLLLKSARGTGGLFEDLMRIDGLDVIDDFRTKSVQNPRYLPVMAARRIDELVVERTIDVVVCRGFEVCREVARQPNAGQRLWAYMTNIPQTAAEMTDAAVEDLTTIASTAERVFAQTDEARDFFEHHVPAARRKMFLLPPMLPDVLREHPQEPLSRRETVSSESDTRRPIRLVYAGKFARGWNTLEMCDLPRRAAEVGLDIELTMIGDKFQGDPDDASWARRMEEAIQTAPGLRWLGAMSREKTLLEVARHDVGLAWRSEELDTSHEISTKLLEYLACGVPPIVNRSVMHENLLGKDYPLFVDGHDVLSALERTTSTDLDSLRESSRAAVEPYWVSTRAAAIGTELARAKAKDISVAEPVRVDIIADETNTELVEATLGSCRGVFTRTLSGDEIHFGPAPRSILVTDVTSLSQVRDRVRPVWVIWDSSAENAQRPTDHIVAGVLVKEASSRRTAAWWAGISISRVFVLPDVTDPTAARPKTPTAPHTVGVIIEPEDAWAAREAHQLLTLLRTENPRFTMRFFLPAIARLSTRPLERELLLDALTDLAVDPLTESAWSLATTSGAATWLREVSWLIGSRPTTIRSFLGLTPKLSRTIEIQLPSINVPSRATNAGHKTQIQQLAARILRNETDTFTEPSPLGAADAQFTRSSQCEELQRLLTAVATISASAWSKGWE